MKAFVINRYGKKEMGHIADVPEPKLGEEDILIQVHAASINPLDLKIRSGEFKLILPYELPLILGNDVAGTVVRTGSHVSRFKVGDEVYARPNKDRIGTFAEYIAINQSDAAIKPSNLSMQQAAAIPLAALTAWQALVDVAKVKPGQRIFIQAGSGGVGSVAIQIAKHLGAFVATTTSTSNVEWVKALGADVVIDYKTQDITAELSDYDVVLNSLGNQELIQSLKILKRGGILVSISGPPTPAFADEIGLNWIVKQVIKLISYSIRKKAEQRGINYVFLFMRANGDQLSKITQLIEQGSIRPVIDRIFSFSAIADALAYAELGNAKGKTIIQMT
jgi:NADPH:quinone reductase-like Zn-dependent oxidoreductase